MGMRMFIFVFFDTWVDLHGKLPIFKFNKVSPEEQGFDSPCGLKVKCRTNSLRRLCARACVRARVRVCKCVRACVWVCVCGVRVGGVRVCGVCVCGVCVCGVCVCGVCVCGVCVCGVCVCGVCVCGMRVGECVIECARAPARVSE